MGLQVLAISVQCLLLRCYEMLLAILPHTGGRTQALDEVISYCK
ncbi:hypothetical protein AALB_3443 [Agarivorans albus MKT 106]|uniref:Uncharacterized protein n=1 Tax=Agarivorans albus MKT 106 TaxID=1331007 RepID=R9PQ17_AGAAL|nr:hypothetical protein AALB_3443 [Agarivorans albus MKT 106]